MNAQSARHAMLLATAALAPLAAMRPGRPMVQADLALAVASPAVARKAPPVQVAPASVRLLPRILAPHRAQPTATAALGARPCSIPRRRLGTEVLAGMPPVNPESGFAIAASQLPLAIAFPCDSISYSS